MSVRMPERIGRARALDLAFTGRLVDGREAIAIGLADRCVPDDALATSTAELAVQVLANSWEANVMLKRLYREQSAMSRPEALAYERTRPYGLPADHEVRRARRHLVPLFARDDLCPAVVARLATARTRWLRRAPSFTTWR
jgi:enoyl-CoA hydratase